MPSVTTLLVFVLGLAALPATAQGGATAPRDPELMNYRLSMDKLRRLPEAQRALNAAHAKNPQLFDILDRERRAMANATVAQRAAMLHRPSRGQKRTHQRRMDSTRLDTDHRGDGQAFTAIAAREGTVTTDAEKANVALLEKNDAEFKKILEELDQLTDELINQSE